ncbi:MAG: acyl carrier protein [Chlorobiaceae bacterium]|nr:acyl carrier protein [Chlorobiaceae bacterium]NTW62764.1 acyl carrier protein [Chlorobiaceae bacterium]
MLSEKELFEKLEDAIRAVLNTEAGDITKESMFKADLDAESIDYLDISYEIEQRTGVELDFTEALQYITEKKGDDITDISVQDIIDYMMLVLRKKEEEEKQ